MTAAASARSSTIATSTCTTTAARLGRRIAPCSACGAPRGPEDVGVRVRVDGRRVLVCGSCAPVLRERARAAQLEPLGRDFGTTSVPVVPKLQPPVVPKMEPDVVACITCGTRSVRLVRSSRGRLVLKAPARAREGEVPRERMASRIHTDGGRVRKIRDNGVGRKATSRLRGRSREANARACHQGRGTSPEE